MKAEILDIQGKKKGTIDLPSQFDETYRPNLIKRAVLSIFGNQRQKYGAFIRAGFRHAVRISKRRRDYKTCYGKGISRVPRKVITRRGSQFNWVGATAPGTVGGRKAHPPKSGKNWEKKINVKERRKAIRSAIAATANPDLVNVSLKLPIIIESKIENFKKTKDVNEFLSKIGLEEEISRTKTKKIRSGKGKRRGRKYKRKKGILFVVSDKCPLQKSSLNIPGADVVTVDSLNAALLAPGTHAGRLTIWSEPAIKKMVEKNLFFEKQRLKK